MRRVLICCLLLLALPALARDPILNPPLACAPGDRCFIAAYVDTDPGPGAADFTCGPLSRDRHGGTDFALPASLVRAREVPVIAAAPGYVANIGTDMPPDGATVPCGTGVIVDHGGGWNTRYCHLRPGSLAVNRGDRVAKGTTLGLIGVPGDAPYAHVHLDVTHDGRTIDPFNADGIIRCEGPEPRQLWQDKIAYRAAGVIDAVVTSKLEITLFGAKADDRLVLQAVGKPPVSLTLDAATNAVEMPLTNRHENATLTLWRDGQPLDSVTLE